jgi:putative endonuclease
MIFVMHYTYLLENQNDKSWYIGFTSNLKRRIFDHLSGNGAETTKRKDGWVLIYYEAYLDKKDAEGRERFLKSGSGRKYLKKQLNSYLS